MATEKKGAETSLPAGQAGLGLVLGAAPSNPEAGPVCHAGEVDTLLEAIRVRVARVVRCSVREKEGMK